MTRFYLNRTEIPAPPAGISSLNQFLKHIEEKHLPPYLIIREVNLDGLPLANDYNVNDPALFRTQFEQSEKIEVMAATVGEIARDSIREALSFLERAQALTPSLAESFQLSPGHEAFDNFKELLNGFYWMNLLLDRLQTNFRIPLEEILIQDLTCKEHQHKFAALLKQLIDSLERADFILLSDLLEYEFLPLIQTWKEMFNKLIQKVEAAS
jgi:hypothetical protein